MRIARMRISVTVLSISLLALLISMLVWLSQEPQAENGSDTTFKDQEVTDGVPLRLGIIPERSIFEQRRRYRVLANYLSAELGRPVELVTSNTYHGALNDMAAGQTDAAFMGSLVAALTLEQLHAQVLVKPQTTDGVSTYHGVIFVRDDSPIKSMDDLAGRSIAMVRTTTAGHLFPIYALSELNLLTGENAVKIRWVGTHDQVIHEVQDGHVDAGAAKDLRIDAYEKSDPTTGYRRLSTSEPVPNNALLVSPELDEAFVQQLRQVLLDMDKHEAGRQVLSDFGAAGFLPCEREEYQAVYDMTEELGPGWGMIGLPPKSASSPKPESRGAIFGTQIEGGF